MPLLVVVLAILYDLYTKLMDWIDDVPPSHTDTLGETVQKFATYEPRLPKSPPPTS